jgi:phage tail-like protein
MKRDEIERLLPAVFQRTLRDGNPLTVFLDAMERLHAPAETVLAELDSTLDPRRTADPFVPVLARWLDLDRVFDAPVGRGAASVARSPISPGLGRLRELVAAATDLSQRRGTASGLKDFLEIATGVDGFVIDEQVPGPDGRPLPFHIKVRAPSATAAHAALIERIIALEKPAYVTHDPVSFE